MWKSIPTAEGQKARQELNRSLSWSSVGNRHEHEEEIAEFPPRSKGLCVPAEQEWQNRDEGAV